MESLPQNLKGSLPTVKEFEAELSKDENHSSGLDGGVTSFGLYCSTL